MANNVNTYTIVDTETQKTQEIKSSATTVAELKRDLRAAGFNVEGKTIQEALTRTEFKDDSSVLPHDVSYKGGITNDLVFRLTKTNKQVRSGMDRQQAYAEVKKLGLGDAIKAKFGKNFTQCSTNDLISFIESQKKPTAGPAATKEECCKPATKSETKEKNDNCPCMGVIKKLIDVLIENDVISEDEAADIMNGVQNVEAATPANGSNPKYSKAELDVLLSGM